MSTVKLTLSVPDAVVRLAKRYAKQHGTSISALVTQLFQQLESHQLESSKTDSISSRAKITASSVGMVKLSKKSKADLIADGISSKFKF